MRRDPKEHGHRADDEGRAQHPAADRPDEVEPVTPPGRILERVAERRAGDQDDEGDRDRHPGAQREAQREPVLPQRRAVALDPVDAVRAALDLAHRRGRRDHGDGEPEIEGGLAAALRALLEGLGEDLACRARGDVAQGVGEDRGERLLTEIAGEADDRDQRREHGERELEGERPRVAEPVRETKASERVAQQMADPGRRAGSRARRRPRDRGSRGPRRRCSSRRRRYRRARIKRAGRRG